MNTFEPKGGIAAVIHRRQGAVPWAVVERLVEALDHRSLQGRAPEVMRSSAAAFACRHRASLLPPDRQPAERIDLLFDGRLDNRADLGRELDVADGTSDARLALLAYRRWGRRFLERLLGPFAVVVVDGARRRTVCGRDPVGGRTLYYHLGAEHLVLASEAAALLEQPEVSDEVDETSLARFFAVRAPSPGATFFAAIRELPAGHRLVLEDGGTSVERFWDPGELPPVRYRRDSDYVDHFREILVESVRCRLPAEGAPAVLMSGGLDSTSVAAVAARELRASCGARLRTASWVFDELPASDERRFIDAMACRFELDSHYIPGDGEWPLRDVETWPVSADAPWQGPYCRLQRRAYEWTRTSGVGVLLTGEYGDHLYLEQSLWLRALLAERRWRDGWRALRRELAGRTLAGLLLPGRPRSAVVRALGWRRRSAAAPSWLTPRARRLVARSQEGADSGILDPLAAHAACLEVGNARRAGVEVRRPYRDRRLIEFFLSIPAHLVYRPGSTKWILRRAMAGVLPENVRCRRWTSTLLPLTARGLAEREQATVRRLLGAPGARWRRYVRGDWLERGFPRRLREHRDGVETVIPWQCICMELWRRALPSTRHSALSMRDTPSRRAHLPM